MRGVQVCKTQDAMWKSWILMKDANGCRFHHPPFMDSGHPLSLFVRGTNEELGGRFWRSIPQDVLIIHGKPFSSMLWRCGLIRVQSFAISFSAAVLLVIWLWNRNESRGEKNGKKFVDFI
ncbi:hypothetical protein CEXT_747381 [Caerostris extrusa]|uniref:Transmembrane protein n=1 Tax=Caerostris extrusa TaxID=172846 RepID=A0AAV4S6A2_CAEEX|nr:hypothetical protein CEXT_747381 [Caerostris extrusa]